MPNLPHADRGGVAVNRRGFLLAASRLGALALAPLLGFAVPAAVAFGRALARAPADVFARIRTRTRPLDPEDLRRPNDLAG